MKNSTLYLLPCPISEDNFESITDQTKKIIAGLRYFVVERAKTSRRYIKSIHPKAVIDDLHLFELDKDHPEKGLVEFLTKMNEGNDMGVMSEAGCPAIADPGNLAVKWAHENGHHVVPISGPSSILLALISSGFNGQNFVFNGYLPNKRPELIPKLKALENEVKSQNRTQLFMDAPYRNGFLLEACIDALNQDTLLCIACDIDSPQQFISTRKILDWKKFDGSSLHKRPAIFIIGK